MEKKKEKIIESKIGKEAKKRYERNKRENIENINNNNNNTKALKRNIEKNNNYPKKPAK